MAATTIQGSNVEFLVRQKDTGDFKEMVCEENLFFDVSNDVSTVKTKCGPFKGVQDPDFKANGTAVFNATPTASEVSYDDVLDWQVALTEVDFIIRNKSQGAYSAGDLVRMSGTGYFVSTQFDGSNGSVSKFSWNLEGTGTLNVTES